MSRFVVGSFVCAVAAFVCMACQTVLEDYYQLAEQKVVINSLITPDSTWKAYVTSTKNINDPAPFRAVGPDATVRILNSENVQLEVLEFSNDICQCYVGQTSPTENERYSIEVNVPGKPLVKATSIVPPAVAIVAVDVDSAGYEFDETVQITVRFNDPGGEQNFYHIKVLKYIGDTYGEEAVPITPLDPSLINDYSSERDLFLSDTHFDGQLFELELKVTRSAYLGVNSPFRVVLESVSDDYYNYFTSKNLQLSSRNDPFAQPFEIVNNVQNGVGVFAGLSVSEHVIDK